MEQNEIDRFGKMIAEGARKQRDDEKEDLPWLRKFINASASPAKEIELAHMALDRIAFRDNPTKPAQGGTPSLAAPIPTTDDYEAALRQEYGGTATADTLIELWMKDRRQLERELAEALEAAREANDPYARSKRLALIEENKILRSATGIQTQQSYEYCPYCHRGPDGDQP